MTIVPIRPNSPAPLTRDHLAILVLAYAETGDIDHAARLAHMTVREALNALRTSGVRAMLARAMRHQVDIVAAPQALAVTVALLRSASEKVRGDAARSLLDRAGLVAAPPEAARDRSLSELSADDLRALIEQLSEEARDRDAAPARSDAPQPPASDWLD